MRQYPLGVTPSLHNVDMFGEKSATRKYLPLKQLFESVGASLLLLTTFAFAICSVGFSFADIPLSVPTWLFVAMLVETIALTVFGSPVEIEDPY